MLYLRDPNLTAERPRCRWLCRATPRLKTESHCKSRLLAYNPGRDLFLRFFFCQAVSPQNQKKETTDMNRVRYFSLLIATLLNLISLEAAISVGPTGTGRQTFDTQPANTDWSTLGPAGGAGTYTDAASLDAA